ncbi:uncharacterized protein KIAA2012 isoform X2 [Xenopus laevis]|uniref:Uncharacterized protein KIAA2012 isoform X2 n=1 Tax=Xenopus laevis TaxID=8355 RepID=A0A8J0TWQ2_XENLA|nr:uncharacterized protein KIAA2012 isoform X2 [Xenopus laevis]
MSNLSLLSRGSAQVVKTTQEKIEVHYDPEDYFNWRSYNNFQTKRFLRGGYSSNRFWEVLPPKTYSTKKGALVLFSEDLALPWWYRVNNKWVQRRHRLKRNKLQLELNTLQDLTEAILAYGRKQKTSSDQQPYLHILREEETQNDRQIRPGYSPKRYLIRLFETWDPSTIYNLQQAGSLRNSVRLQPLTTNYAASGRRHQDLSSVPLKYQCPSAFLPHPNPHWNHDDLFTTSGRFTPVQEENENEEELVHDVDIAEESRKKKSAFPVTNIEALQSSDADTVDTYKRKNTWRRKGKQLESSQVNNEVTSDISQHPFFHIDGSLEKNISEATQVKPHFTFYGGPFTGRRKFQQDEAGFLPPISQFVGSDTGAKKESITKRDSFKLPPIFDEISRAPKRKRRCQATDPPKELLVIPLLIHFQPQQPKQEEKPNRAESTQDYLESQDIVKENRDVPPLAEDVHMRLPENKINTLQMDIEWNAHQHADGDLLLMHEAPPLGSLPPINGKKGPGNQSSMANLKATNMSNSNSTGPKTLPTGIIRGSLPEELKECCKNNSMGSLIMSPDGEIVCLSLLGSARDADVPVRFDFIPEEEDNEEEEEVDSLSLESKGQEEQWPSNQQDMEQGADGRKTLSVHIPTSSPEEAAPVPIHRKDKKKHGAPPRPNPPEDDAKTSKQLTQGERSKNRRVKEVDSAVHEQGSMADMTEPPPVHTVTASSKRDSICTDQTNASSASSRRTSGAKFSPDTASEAKGQDEFSNDKQALSTETSGRMSPINNKQKMQNMESDVQGLYQKSSREDKIVQGSPAKKPDYPRIKSEFQKETSNSETRKKIREQGIAAEKNLNHEVTAPPSVQGQHSTKSEETNKKGPMKEQSKKQKALEATEKRQSEPSGETTEILKSLGKVPNGSREKLPTIPSQALQDIGKVPNQNEQKAMTEDEEMELLEQIASNTMKETSKIKEKKKNQKAQKSLKTPTAEAKKTKQKDTKKQGKAAFVVGQPKEKKPEEIPSPMKPTGVLNRQETITESSDSNHKKQKNDIPEIEVEVPSLTVVTPERSSTPADSEDHLLSAPDGEDIEILDPVAEQSATDDKQMAETSKEVLSQPSEYDYAHSETSEATTTSLRRQRSSRVQELSDKAERRRIEVERKRKEREEQLRLEQEQQERMEKMKTELDQEQQRRAEEIRMKKHHEEEEKRRQEQERARRLQLEQQALERARQQQEEHRRKLQEIHRRKQQEELERMELERQRQMQIEREAAEEHLRLQDMAAEEREEYKRKKQEKEEQARREAEEKRRKAEEEAKAVMEEARRQAQLLARQTAALEKQLQFNKGLLKESVGLDQTQGVSKPWVFSYFEFIELPLLPLSVQGD